MRWNLVPDHADPNVARTSTPCKNGNQQPTPWAVNWETGRLCFQLPDTLRETDWYVDRVTGWVRPRHAEGQPATSQFAPYPGLVEADFQVGAALGTAVRQGGSPQQHPRIYLGAEAPAGDQANVDPRAIDPALLDPNLSDPNIQASVVTREASPEDADLWGTP